MRFIDEYDLFLFDFDGLLVNTERFHFAAYQRALFDRGCHLPWDFPEYASYAHLNQRALRDALSEMFPFLQEEWDLFYEEKKRAYIQVIASMDVELMPGVAPFLSEVVAKKKKMAVVTNSWREQVAAIRRRIPLLGQIPEWITREEYTSAKPSPDGYLLAIARLGQEGDRIIGFEDSIRGIEALLQTPATAVLICDPSHPLLPAAPPEVLYFGSFLEL